ncbi:recombinase family protein [Pseudomonas atacamensis]|uniref:recombinase family protein n=1 Tax=Pseudomonas atacamensis TaxID=2565368 RepID=UPI0024818C20|nr:recombinase family protein [Pseudomonas atacamensis]WGT32976.1 recombinase family protein [Pseudomonas atacamensis]
MSKVFSYIRFSSAKQSAGDSEARQMRAAKEFAVERGLQLADPTEYLFFDRGRSAYTGKHLDDTGELARFLAFVDDGTIPSGSFLVVESLDRLSREKVRDALPRFLDLLAKGINVYTSTDKRLYTRDYNEIDLIISIISMSRAHEESATKGSRVSSAWRKKQADARASGKPLGKLRPLWLDVTPEGYTLNTERAQVVRRIFDLSTQGHGSRNIAATLNQEGVPAFSAGRKNLSGLWGFSTVRHVLGSRATLGEYLPHVFVNGVRTPDGEPIKDFFPAVVSEETFYRAQAARGSRRLHKITRQTKDFNVMAGIFFCFDCGAAMHLQTQRGRRYFKCSHSTRGMCNAGVITATRTETVFREILAKLDSLSLVQDSAGSIRKKLDVVEGRTVELRSKLAAAEDAHNEYPSRTTAKLLHELEGELSSLDAEKDTLRQQMAVDRVMSKEHFFEKLDLVSFGGRAAANNLTKRLGTKIFVRKNGRCDETYLIGVTAADEAEPSVIGAITHTNKKIRIDSASDAFTELQALHGDLPKWQRDAKSWRKEIKVPVLPELKSQRR